MSNNNPIGINQYGRKNYPSDEKMQQALHQYAKERLSVEERLQRLRADLGFECKKSLLHKLNKKYNVPSVRKPPAEDIATAAVLQKVAEDPAQRRGVGTIGTMLSNEGISLPRDFIRKILAQHAPEGLAARFPGANRIRRSALVAVGPNYQHHADGHEKLNAQALQMGGVGLNIYGIKDQWSSFILLLVVVPNNRLTTTIGHVHLDCVEQYGFIPITFVVDKGSETGYIFANQTALRQSYASDLDEDRFPPVQHLRSVHNTPIEGLWHWFTDYCGINAKDIIREGYTRGFYNPNDVVHVSLFYWLWPKILQLELDKFVEYWNNHKIRYQPKKPNMSGATPRHAFTVPESQGAQECRINVDKFVIDALRGEIPVSREDAMRWVDEEFNTAAQAAYITIHQPILELKAGWSIFSSMVSALKQA